MMEYNVKGTYEPRDLEEVVGEIKSEMEVEKGADLRELTTLEKIACGGIVIGGPILGILAAHVEKITNLKYVGAIGVVLFSAPQLPVVQYIFSGKEQDEKYEIGYTVATILAGGFFVGAATTYICSKIF